MKLINILLFEDNILEAQTVMQQIRNNYKITLVQTLKEAKEAIHSAQYDLSIVDIKIGDTLDGIEFAKYLQESQSPIPFLFLSGMRSKIIFERAKITAPFTYLLKPFNPLELEYSIELAIEKYYGQINSLRSENSLLTRDFLLIKNQHRIFKLDLEDIEYIEVDDNYSTFFTDTKKYTVKKSLSKVKKILIGKNFDQTHRKFLVNFDKVQEINLSENTIYLKSKLQVVISDRYKKQLSKRFDLLK